MVVEAVPDLNPDEGVRGWTTYGRLANLATNDKPELWDHVVDELIDAKHRPDLLRAFIRQTDWPGLTRGITGFFFGRYWPGG